MIPGLSIRLSATTPILFDRDIAPDNISAVPKKPIECNEYIPLFFFRFYHTITNCFAAYPVQIGKKIL